MMIMTFVNQYLIPLLVLSMIGLFFGILISVLSKVFYVEDDTRIATVHSMLPGYNCGACGHPGCSGMATAIVENGAPVTNCKPIKPDQVQAIRDFLKQLEDKKNS